MSMSAKTVPAGAFKQGCLRILDEVAETHREVVITKRGKPVAKLVLFDSDNASATGCGVPVHDATINDTVSNWRNVAPCGS